MKGSPAARKRMRRTSGAFLSQNEFRVLELVAPCPAIVRQTAKEALLTPFMLSAAFEPSGFAIVVSPTRLIVWNAFHPEEPPIALAFEPHDIDRSAARRVGLQYDRPVQQRALRAIVYAQSSGLIVHITTDGHQSRLSLSLQPGEKVALLTLVNSRLGLIATTHHRLLTLTVSNDSMSTAVVNTNRGLAGGVFGRLFGASATASPSLPYLRLICHAPMRLMAASHEVIDELAASESGAWSVSSSSSLPLQDALDLLPGSSDARIVDIAVVQERIAVLVSVCTGPLNQAQFCIGLYKRKEHDLVAVFREQLIESFDAEGEAPDSLQVELSDQDAALIFVFGRRILSVFNLATSINDCIRFDDPTLLGGGRGRDHRGCFFVSAVNGIICARLAKGPTTANLAYTDSTAAPWDHGELSSAFLAFQQARIANCRAMVLSLDVDIGAESRLISRAIVDAESVSLTKKQSHHTAFCEFLHAMPSAQDELWSRLSPQVQRVIVLDGDAIELALALHHIIYAPSSQFHEILATSRAEFDIARNEFLQTVLSVDRFDEALFARLSTLTTSLCLFGTGLARVRSSTSTWLFALVFVCRVYRVVFSLASESTHRDHVGPEASWLWDRSTREALLSLLSHLGDAIGFQCSSPDHIQDGFAYTNYYYIACLLLNGYLMQFVELDAVPGRQTIRDQLDVEYRSHRSRIGRVLISSAPEHCDPRRRLALAFEFGERFADCAILAELCESCAWPERSDAYAREFGDAYSLSCCETWFAARDYSKLLSHVGQPWLAQFVEDKPRLSWIVDLDQGNLPLVSTKLQALADDDNVELRLREFFSAMAKLTYLHTLSAQPV